MGFDRNVPMSLCGARGAARLRVGQLDQVGAVLIVHDGRIHSCLAAHRDLENCPALCQAHAAGAGRVDGEARLHLHTWWRGLAEYSRGTGNGSPGPQQAALIADFGAAPAAR